MNSFAAWIAAWLSNRYGSEVASIEEISSSNWQNNPAAGCGCDRFEVEIKWTDRNSIKHFEWISGDDMKSLWDWLVSA